MKKYFVTASLLALLAACGSGSNSSTSADSTAASTSSTTDITTNPDYQKGLALVAKNDCLTCHKVEEKLVGPAYQDVANKYANASDTIVTHLAHKVIAGGSGVWGQVPMTPHPQVSEADAEQMVKYVLLLKTK